MQDFDFSVVLPLQVKAETFSGVPHAIRRAAGAAGARRLSGELRRIHPADLLVLGFGTRFAALGLLIMTAVIDVYVMPQALWSMHIYWDAILLVLLSLGAGQISVDHVIRFVTRR